MTYKIYRDDYNTNYESVKIERTDFSDAQEILSLQKLAYQSEAELINDFSIQPLTQTIEEMKEDIETQLIYKASILKMGPGTNNIKKIKRDRIIASVRACEKGTTCYIGKLIVHPEYQGLGLGREMMKIMEESFSGASRFELFTGDKSIKNIGLYKGLGYNVFKKEKVNDLLNFIFMEKHSGTKEKPGEAASIY